MSAHVIPDIADQDQSAVIAFLSRPGSYGLRDTKVERIETHCSIVFLTEELAYKLKRSICYGDADYTTREKRHAACDAEIILNRRTAPQLYLGVRAICRQAGSELVFDGPGLPLDHVVVMRRFAQQDLFDRMAENGQLTPALMQALGIVIARFHENAAPRPKHGGALALKHVIEEISQELSRHAALLGQVHLDLLNERLHVMLKQISPLLDQRRREGKIRRCHGDLRLANICLWQGQPTLFDAIEFSEKVACIDVLYDLAFLLMDLRIRGLGTLAKLLLEAYLAHAPEQEGLGTLPLFLALRAAMRAYALADSAGRQPEPTRAEMKRAEAQHHFLAAIGFLSPYGGACDDLY